MPSNGKPYRVYRGGRIARPRRRIRSEDDIRLPIGAGHRSEHDEPPTDEAGAPASADSPEGPDPVIDLEPDSELDEAAPESDLPDSADPGGEGWAVVEPPPARRPGALPPTVETTPGRPPRRLRRSRPRVDPPAERPRRGLRVVWSLTKWALGLALLAAFAIVAWGVIGFFIIRGGVNEANDRMGAEALAQLSEPPGSALTTPRTILFLGVDTGGAREGTGRADSIVLLRTDPDNHRISLLSIPRDLRVEVPGRGLDKINSAYAQGGASLMISVVEEVTRVPIHHAALIDFDSFPEVIDAVGGVTIDVPAPIVSKRFDCPYPSQVACEQWSGWRFSKGEQTMSGRRALIYSRIRENALDDSESDVTRGSRQQEVIRATADQLVSLRTFARLPFVGRDVTTPLTTDLTTSELFELAWVKFRTPDEGVIQCRLGGSATRIDGVSYLIGTSQNPVVVNMFLGRAQPRKPQASAGPFAPGCPVSGGRAADTP